MKENNKKNKILLLLKNGDALATSKIAFMISANLYQTEAYLLELKEEGQIIDLSENNATYWKLNKEVITDGKEI